MTYAETHLLGKTVDMRGKQAVDFRVIVLQEHPKSDGILRIAAGDDWTLGAWLKANGVRYEVDKHTTPGYVRMLWEGEMDDAV